MTIQIALEPRKFEPRQRVRAKIYKDRKYSSGLTVLKDVVLTGKIVGFEDGRFLGRHTPSYNGWAYHVDLDNIEGLFIVPEEDLESTQ